MMVHGVYTALITPFKTDKSLDLDGWIHNINYQIENNIDGLVVLGTTGEAPTITSEEQKLLITTAVETTKNKIPVFVGTGSYSTEQTIKQTRLAKELGADGALIVTPYYNKPTQEGIYLHFKSICESVDFPIIVYNIQGRCGQNIATKTIKRISEFDNIVAVKEASGNIVQVMDVRATIPNLTVMSGDDILTLPIMALGGSGVISVASNLIPDAIKTLVETGENFYKLLPLIKGLFLETNPIPLKAAMNLKNMAAGPCRLPLCDMQQETYEQLKTTLLEYEKN